MTIEQMIERAEQNVRDRMVACLRIGIDIGPAYDALVGFND